MRCVLLYEEVQQYGARCTVGLRCASVSGGCVEEQLKVVALLSMEGAEGRLRGGLWLLIEEQSGRCSAPSGDQRPNLREQREEGG